jgi:hypothetical protein
VAPGRIAHEPSAGYVLRSVAAALVGAIQIVLGGEGSFGTPFGTPCRTACFGTRKVLELQWPLRWQSHVQFAEKAAEVAPTNAQAADLGVVAAMRPAGPVAANRAASPAPGASLCCRMRRASRFTRQPMSWRCWRRSFRNC